MSQQDSTKAEVKVAAQLGQIELRPYLIGVAVKSLVAAVALYVVIDLAAPAKVKTWAKPAAVAGFVAFPAIATGAVGLIEWENRRRQAELRTAAAIGVSLSPSRIGVTNESIQRSASIQPSEAAPPESSPNSGASRTGTKNRSLFSAPGKAAPSEPRPVTDWEIEPATNSQSARVPTQGQSSSSRARGGDRGNVVTLFSGATNPKPAEPAPVAAPNPLFSGGPRTNSTSNPANNPASNSTRRTPSPSPVYDQAEAEPIIPDIPLGVGGDRNGSSNQGVTPSTPSAIGPTTPSMGDIFGGSPWDGEAVG